MVPVLLALTLSDLMSSDVIRGHGGTREILKLMDMVR